MSDSLISSRSISDFAWLLTRDRSFFIAIFAFILPGVLVVIGDVPEVALLCASLAERLAQLWSIALVYRYGAQLLPTPRRLEVSARFIVVGILVEITLLFAVLTLVRSTGWGAFLMVVATALMLRFWLNFLLYPMPLLDTQLTDWRAVLVSARALTQRVSLRSLFFWPLALALIVSGLAFAQYPDGRMWWSLPVAQAGVGFAHLVLVYRGAAATFLALGAPPVHATRARFGSPALLILAGCLLWAANFVRLLSLPPSPTLSVISVTGRSESPSAPTEIVVSLRAEDPRFNFVGFIPERFYIGGETAFPVTGFPRVESKPASDDASKRDYELVFRSDRSLKDLSELSDLSLWYVRAKVAGIAIPKPQN